MNEIEIAKAVADGNSGSLVGGAILVLIVAIPLFIKMLSWSRETNANGALYAQLSEQVGKLKQELDNVYAAKHQQTEELFKLRARVEHLEQTESLVDALKKKLDEKDLIIAERDARISVLTNEVLQMKDRVHHLEMRMTKDEREFCRSCTVKQSVVV